MGNGTNTYVLLFLLPLFLSGCKSGELYQPYPAENYFVAAHRGFHTDVPENPVVSNEKAIQYNIDIVEIDVRISKDYKPLTNKNH
ncbi:MAG: glycerophosphodiester phosphodiesterase family protein [Balneolales bacterium]